MHTHQYQCCNNKTELVKLAAVFCKYKNTHFFQNIYNSKIYQDILYKLKAFR